MISLNNLVNELFDDSARIASSVGKEAGRYLSNTGQYARNIGKIATYPVRHPGTSLAVSNCLASQAADVITTLMNVNKYGTSREGGELPRFFMETFGPLEGQLILKGIAAPFFLGGLYLSGKALGYCYAKNDKLRGVIENAPLHIFSILFYLTAINNYRIFTS